MEFRSPALATAAFAAVLYGCGSSRPPEPELSARPIGKPMPVAVPLGLPPLPESLDNPVTAQTIVLGQKLFFSPLLSVDGTVTCASCHDPGKGFADGRNVSPGVHGKLGKRNAPSIVNAAYKPLQFWDGRAQGLEAQASGPMLNPVEMGHTIQGVEKRVSQDPALSALFAAAFGAAPAGRSPVTMARVTNALAAYERTILRGNSPFDRYYYGGDKQALSESAQRGLTLFRDPGGANCAACHTVENTYALFTDNKFHNLGVGLSPEGNLTDLGRYDVTKREEDKGAFLTPGLRNVAETAPYMHDGSLKTLRQVVDFYVGGGSSNPHLDKEMKPLDHLTNRDREDLVAFLESLTGEAAK